MRRMTWLLLLQEIDALQEAVRTRDLTISRLSKLLDQRTVSVEELFSSMVEEMKKKESEKKVEFPPSVEDLAVCRLIICSFLNLYQLMVMCGCVCMYFRNG